MFTADDVAPEIADARDQATNYFEARTEDTTRGQARVYYALLAFLVQAFTILLNEIRANQQGQR